MKLSQCIEEVHRCIHLHPEYNYHYFENIGMEKEKYLHDTELILGSLSLIFTINHTPQHLLRRI